MTLDKPNILLIQADQVCAQALTAYSKNAVAKTPNLEALAEDGVVFESAYCNNPICAPSRFSMLSGQHTSRIQAFDNGAEFPGDIPTIAHYLRAEGYQTCLSGKMHFVGADQLHGYEERLTTDVYPSDHGWTPDWSKPEERIDWWYHNMDSVRESGPCERTNQIDFDDEVAFRAVRKVYDLGRSQDSRPFFLTVSFTNPHDPYACPKEHWDRYEDAEINMPEVGYLPDDVLDPHSRRLRDAYLQHPDAATEEQIRNARHAYYGQLSYIDDKIGQIRKALADTGLDENTIILFTSDHGDMLGEKGMWYKMSFFEQSIRVPFVVHYPARFAKRRISNHVSLVDMLPTLLDIADSDSINTPAAPLDGDSLLPLLNGDKWPDDRCVIAEFFAEGSCGPCFMVRQGPYKYIYTEPDPPQLYNLETDPKELFDLAGLPDYHEVELSLHKAMQAHQNPEVIRQQVIASQQRRKIVFTANMCGTHTPWDYSPKQNSAAQYMRNNLDLNEVESNARIKSRA